MKPIHNKVLVRTHKKEQKTSSGIHIPNGKPGVKPEGTVVRVGPGNVSQATGNIIPMSVSEGDIVIYNNLAAQIVDSIDGDELVIISEDEIIAVKS